ncbi:MAG: hypothetical protein HYY24_29495 [Verrucomicrobia bacterium]|nr:hypothetical protein [Verrucomicrobiota bacterium]
MQAPSAGPLTRLSFAAFLMLAPLSAALGQADAYRGLWVGQVTLNYVNEVSVPLDENNIPIAPDPKVPTPTADQAHLRLILHVNGAGQVSLLKDVAILNRKGGGTEAAINGRPVNLGTNPDALTPSDTHLEAESDVALVTDERLYGEFPPQPAVRIASAVFDFGDSRATDALNEVMAKAAEAAGSSIFGQPSSMFTTSAGRKAAEDAAKLVAKTAAAPIVPAADVATSFFEFLRDEFDASTVNAIAAAANPAAEAATVRGLAVTLQNSSFYGDSRAVQMIDAVVAAVVAAATPAAKTKDAHNTASSYADVTDNYQRFIAGKVLGDAIAGAAQAAAAAAVAPAATATTIRDAVTANGAVIEARSQALTYRVSMYTDTRAPDAVEVVLDAVIASAAAALPAAPGSEETIRTAADQAGRTALANGVRRYPIATQAPTLEYNSFVTSQSFKNSPDTAAAAAAAAAVSERVNNPLYTAQSLENAALVGAVTALRDVFGAAARTVRTELPLTGKLGPGVGDPRLSYDIKKQNLAPLGAAALEGTLFLPANHPTNPFRHRRHPDHTVGLDLQRKLRLDFNGSVGDPLGRAGFGVDRITGTYREEVFGLHKPLGPNKDIGLKVEGTFELNRLSLIDTLNAR